MLSDQYVSYFPLFFPTLGWCLNGQCFGNPNPYNLSKKYGSTPPICTAVRPPICIAVHSWLLSFKKKENLQYASHLYCSTPPICRAVRPPFVRQHFWKNTGGWVTGTFHNLTKKTATPKHCRCQMMEAFLCPV